MSLLYPFSASAIPAAGTDVSATFTEFGDAAYLLVQAKFDWTSGGSAVKLFVQTSLDGGTTWIDIMCFAFAGADATKISKVLAVSALTAATVPTDGSLADNTVLDGLIGDRIRVKRVVTGTYVDSTCTVSVESK